MEKYLPSKKGKNVLTNFAAIIFLIVGSLHLLRAIAGWEAYVGGIMIPIWVSWVAVLVALYLSYSMFQMDK